MTQLQASDGTTFFVSECDADNVSRYKWFINSNGYLLRSNKNKHEYLHRLILIARDSEYVDHINGNKLDNSRENLRLVTNKQNTRNCAISKNNSSGYKGVSKYKDRWRAYIAVDGKQIHLGVFDDKENAALAYDNAAKEHFGKYARFNLLKEEEAQ